MSEKKKVFLVAEDVLKQMFEGKSEGKAKELMKLMKKIKDGGGDLIVKTPMSHFLRALFLSDPKLPIQNIQKVLSFTQVLPSFANFKDEKQCRNEIIMIAGAMSGKKENGHK